ncbi:MAG: c-type cytochrome biogenesis protein CcmI [Rhodocyclaceae bacterium]|nr:c-type cytochrome biogenesis protein CcmI [Rhodocyclaceae bacterium]
MSGTGLFVLLSAALTGLALVFLLPPLLGRGFRRGNRAPGSPDLSLAVLRDQFAELEREHHAGRINDAAFEAERAELERRALEDGSLRIRSTIDSRRPWLVGAVALAVPGIAAALYLHLGTPAAMAPQDAGGSHALSAQQIQSMVLKLAERLQDNPQDGEGWLMLARSYAVLGRYAESAAAYGRAMSILPPDAVHLADYADTLAMAQGRRLAGDPERVIQRALAADPRNVKALALSGTAAFERRDYARAIGEWEKILALVPADSKVAAGIANSIADARSRLGPAGDGAGGIPAQAAGPAPAVTVRVALDPALEGQVRPDDTLFVFARAAEGPRMPVAMVRRKASELPLRLALDDSMGVGPGPRLSAAGTVVVGARVSRSGDALPKSGDLEGYAQPMRVGAGEAAVSITSRVP